MSTSLCKKSKTQKTSPQSIAELDSELRGDFSFLQEEAFQKLVECCKNLSLGDPLLVLHWNDAAIAAAELENPQHTKVLTNCFIIVTLTSLYY